MKGTGGLVLYLHYDGVHHENCLWHSRRGAYVVAPERYTLFQHSGLLERMLEPYPTVQIVLSTSWVRRYGMTDTAKRLSLSLQARLSKPNAPLTQVPAAYVSSGLFAAVKEFQFELPPLKRHQHLS